MHGPWPASPEPETVPVPSRKAAAGKWKGDPGHCEIRTLLKCRLNSLQIPAQVSCIIFYRDCISASVCMTLPVLNRTKARRCVSPVSSSIFICSFADAVFLSGVPKSIPLPDPPFPGTWRSGWRDFWGDKLRPGCFPSRRRRKGTCLWCLLCRES